jgi:multiple sugar transport system permease protein
MTFDRLRRYPRRSLRRLLRHVASLALAAIFVVPLFWSAAFSLRQTGQAPPLRIEWLPSPVVWANYTTIFRLVPLASYILNSLIVAALAVPITLIVASWAGFAMAQLPAATRRRLTTLAVVLLMVPATSLWLTRFVLFTYLGLVDTVWALVAPALMGSSPFYVLLFYWTFRRLPLELFESARLEGAGPLAIWSQIAMPLARPTIIAVTVLAFSLYWNDFISPLLYLKSESLYTLPIGLSLLAQMDQTNWPLLMAGATVMTTPVILLFLLVQRYFWPEGRLSGMSGR